MARSERFELPTLGIEIHHQVRKINYLIRDRASNPLLNINGLARLCQTGRLHSVGPGNGEAGHSPE
jgi:hypothetical protein